VLIKNSENLSPERAVNLGHDGPVFAVSDTQEVADFASPIARLDLDTDIVDAVTLTLVNRDKTALLEEFILENLAFTTMKEREKEVAAVHRNTFEFMFDESLNSGSNILSLDSSDNSFIRWLRDSEVSGVYWISGKAGSGKSTLMRFIWEDPRTVQCLKTWAGEKFLSTARFYFWTSGNVVQRSPAGLLRYLLHQLLSQRRDIIPWVFPDLWLFCQDTKNRVKAALEWPSTLLMTAFQRYLHKSAGQSKLFLAIDGLDELDGDQQAMVEMIKSTVESSPGNIKVCVSSRPWPVFEQFYYKTPQLKLQDLTFNDIRQYASDSLNKLPTSRRIMRKEPQKSERLKENIARNADGVFLWAALALKALIARISSQDTVADVEAKLNTLPTDLDDLFRHLLFESRTPSDLEEQARILLIIRAREAVCDMTMDESSNTLTLYLLALADHGENIDITLPIEQPSAEEITETCKEMRDRLSSLCAGLLVLHGGDSVRVGTHARFADPEKVDAQALAQSRVSYLHRTVRDFLIQSGAFHSAEQHTDSEFDAYICLLISHILRLKLPLEEPEHHRRLDEWWPDVVLAMTSAQLAKANSKEMLVSLLNEFKTTLDWYWLGKSSDRLDNWARNAFATFEVRMKFRTPYHYPFLSLSTKFGLFDYVESELRTGRYPYQGGIPLLAYAVEHLANRRKTIYPLSTPAFVGMLLANGGDPNLKYQDLFGKQTTPWLLTLEYVREADRRGWIRVYDVDLNGTKRWVEILRIFIQHGADPNALILKDSWDPAATAMDVVSGVFEKFASQDLKELLELLSAYKAIDRAVALEPRFQ
jgi:hypothetical protein